MHIYVTLYFYVCLYLFILWCFKVWSFIQQMFTEHLLCARYHLDIEDTPMNKTGIPAKIEIQGAYILVEGERQY